MRTSRGPAGAGAAQDRGEVGTVHNCAGSGGRWRADALEVGRGSFR